MSTEESDELKRERLLAKAERARTELAKLEAEVEESRLERVKEEASGYVEHRSRWALVCLDSARPMLQRAYEQVMGEGQVWGDNDKAKPLNDSQQVAEYHFDSIFEALTAIEELVRGSEMHQWFEERK